MKTKRDRACRDCTACQAPNILGSDLKVEYWPRHLVLEVTNQCDLDCIMCERQLVQPDDLMPNEIFDMCVEKFVPFAQAVELSGLGEPTLSPNFPRQAQAVADANRILYFPTNGAALGHDRTLKVLRDTNDTRVSLSIDAATPATYAKIRVKKNGRPGDWDKLWRNYELFRAAKPNAFVTSCFTAGAYNIDEFPAFVRLAIEKGFNEVAFKQVRVWGQDPATTSLRFFKGRTEQAISEAQEAAKRGNLSLKIEQPSFALGQENGGSRGFISYLDIVPLGLFECAASATSASGGTGSIETNSILSTILNVGEAEIVPGGVIRSPIKRRIVRTDNVMVVLSTGDVCTCGAKHKLGHVSKGDMPYFVGLPAYQAHLRARAMGRPDLSKYCKSCAKMM